jgi:site-specific DNA recombinase
MFRPRGLDLLLYLRKSRKDQDDERRAALNGEAYDTLERHRNRLMEVAKAEQHNIIDIMEEVASGENIVERPVMQELLRRVQQGEVDGVLVVDLDRLGRGDMLDQGLIDRAFRESGTKIITPTDVYDPEEESWELIFGVKSIISRQELKQINKRLQNGRVDSVKEGKHIAKKPPYGYKRTDELKLVPDEDTAWVVRKIFEMMKDGVGRISIARELDSLGIAPPQSNHKRRKNSDGWRACSITEIVRNEVYIGHLVWGKVKSIKQGGKYKRVRMPKEKWVIKENAHEPLVSQELFEEANKAHSGRWRPHTIEAKKLSNPLAGILICEICGHAMVLQPRKDRPNHSLRCMQSSCKGVQKGVLLPLVEERILSILSEIVKQYEGNVDFRKQKSSFEKNIEIRKKIFDKKKQELEDLIKQKDTLHDLLEKGVYSIEVFLERQNVLVTRIKEKQKEIDLLEEEIKQEEMRKHNVVDFIPKMKKILTAYHGTKDIEKKNRLLKSVIEKATYLRSKDMTKKDEFIVQLYTKV